MNMRQRPFNPFTVITLGLLALPMHVIADPWTSFPGTKARGMGTAFTAIADDPSAAWHNPAGLYQMNGLNLSLETGNAPKYQLHSDTEYMVFDYSGAAIDLDPVESNPNVPELTGYRVFDAWSNASDENDSSFLSLNKGDGQTYGIAVYYYEPYHIQYNVDNNQGEGSTSIKDIRLTGLIREKVSITGIGYSGMLFNHKKRNWLSSFYYGFTLEYINNSISNSTLNLSDAFDNELTLDDTSLVKPKGWSGSTGFLTTLYQGQIRNPLSPTIKLGGVYRWQTNKKNQSLVWANEVSDAHYDQTFNTREWFNAKPASWDLGLGSVMQLTSGPGFGLISSQLSLQHGNTQFNSEFTATDYRRTALGAAVRLTRLRGAFIQQLELRFGVYQEKATSQVNQILQSNPVYIDVERGNFRFVRNFELGLAFPETKGLTWGLQLAFSNGLLFEFAAEQRQLNHVFGCVGGNISAANCTDKNTERRYWTAALRYNW